MTAAVYRFLNKALHWIYCLTRQECQKSQKLNKMMVKKKKNKKKKKKLKKKPKKQSKRKLNRPLRLTAKKKRSFLSM